MVVPQDVEFKTVDGITLRGHLFSARNRGPGVVMSPGVSSRNAISAASQLDSSCVSIEVI